MKEAVRTQRFIRVLGVDPAAAGRTGYGVVESDGRQSRVLHYGALPAGAGIRNGPAGATGKAAAALCAVHQKMCGLITEFEPDVLAVESVFTALNKKTALRLAEVRGVVLLAAAQHGLDVHSYAPREIKASVAGYGHADKRQIQLMVRAILSMSEAPDPADAADALAVALCHIQRDATRARFHLPQHSGSTASALVSGRSAYSSQRTPLPAISATR